MKEYKMRMSKEKVEKFREDFDKENIFEDEELAEISFKDQLRIHKKFNSKENPKFKLTWEYLKNHMEKCPLDKKKIIKDLKINKQTLELYLCELNRYIKTKSVRWFHVPGKKDFIETAGFNQLHDVKIIKERTKKQTSEILRTAQTSHIIKYNEELKSLQERKKEIENVLYNKKRVRGRN